MFAKIRYPDGKTASNFYADYDSFIRETFSPEVDILMLLPLEIRGKDYQSRKESARELAINFQYENDGDTDYQLSYSESAAIYHFFYKIGKRYGLLREFRENAII